MITIYRLYNEDGRCYIGSTIKNPWIRFMEHKYGHQNKNASISSYDLFDIGKPVYMEPLEMCMEQDRMDTEGYWIKQYEDSCVNRYKMDIDYECYQKNYQTRRWTHLNQKIKCKCGCVISRKNMATHKKRPLHKKNLIYLKTNQKYEYIEWVENDA